MVEGIVTNENNSCKIVVINTEEDDVTFEVNPQDILQFEYAKTEFGSSDSDNETDVTPITEWKQRVEELKKPLSVLAELH